MQVKLAQIDALITWRNYTPLPLVAGTRVFNQIQNS